MKTIQEKYSDALNKFKEDTVELATKLFREQGNKLSEPLVFALVIKNKEVTMGMLVGLGKLFKSELGKEAAVDIIRELGKEIKPIGLAFCSEGYASVQKRPDNMSEEDFINSNHIRPSMDPNKKEVLFFTFETFDKEAGEYLEIVRDGDNVNLEHMHTIQWTPKDKISVGGRFTHLLQDNYSEFALTIKEELKTSLN
jgi:hypothetical protein